MSDAPKLTRDGFRLVVEQAGKHFVFLDRRCGIIWTGPHNPYYYAIFGLLDEATLGGPKPLCLLAEAVIQIQDVFHTNLLATCNKWGCSGLYADTRQDSHFNALYDFVRLKNIKGLSLLDSSDFTSFEQSKAPVELRLKYGSLRIPAKTKLDEQMQVFDPTHLKDQVIKPEERFYAVYALAQVVCSYEFYPWAKPRKAQPGAKATNGYR